MSDIIFQAVQIIKSSKVIIYPTETFWGMGGLGTSPEVVQKLRVLKNRPSHKPFPLVAGHFQQAMQYVDMDHEGLELARQFWPGSLSIIARAARDLAPGVRDEQGMVSIRVTPHPTAAVLCLAADAPLVATSANLSGERSCALFEELDRALLEKVDMVLQHGPPPGGGQPSTLVRMLGAGKVEIIREGRVTSSDLKNRGWKTV